MTTQSIEGAASALQEESFNEGVNYGYLNGGYAAVHPDWRTVRPSAVFVLDLARSVIDREWPRPQIPAEREAFLAGYVQGFWQRFNRDR